MELRTLGKSGIKSSEIALGCWAIGGPAWRDGNPVGWSGADDGQSLEGLKRGFDLGINHFDSADVYGDGHSELLIGNFLKSVNRRDVVLASKVGWFRGTAPHPFHPLHVRHQIEQSLDNFGTDYIDIYYFHNADFGPDDANLQGAAEVVHRAKQEGKIRAVGQSAYSYEDFQRVAPVTQPDVLQFHYNALDPSFDEPEGDLFAWAESRNLGMVLFGPLAQGLLLDKYDPERPPKFGDGDIRMKNKGFTKAGLLKLRTKLQKIKEKYGSSTEDLAKAALKYCLARSPLAVAIPGFKNRRQVEINASASDGKPFSAADLEFIRSILR